MELRKAVDNLCIYDPEFEQSAEKFLSETGSNSAAQAVRNRDELVTAIDSFTNVKFLEILLHGLPGMIIFANNSGMIAQNIGSIAQGKPFLQRNARILFDSCEIGKGKQGDVFMDELGASLLTGRGGIIGATTVANIVILPTTFLCSDVYMKPFNDGQLKVRRYDTNGKRTGERIVDRYGNTH